MQDLKLLVTSLESQLCRKQEILRNIERNLKFRAYLDIFMFWYVPIRHIIADIWTADRGTEISAEFETRFPDLLFVSNDTNLKLSLPFLFQATFTWFAYVSVHVHRNVLILIVFLDLKQFQKRKQLICEIYVWGASPSDTRFTHQLNMF